MEWSEEKRHALVAPVVILADFILEIIIKGPENVIIYTIFGDNCREIQKYVKIYVVMFVVGYTRRKLYTIKHK
jgi:hypothetical protein